MVSRARLSRVGDRLKSARAARAGRVDTSTLGDLVMSNSHARTYLDADADGQPVSTLVTRGGSVLRVIGLDLRCAFGDCGHDHSAPTTPQPEAVSRPAVATQPPMPVAQPDAPKPPAADQPPQRTGYGRLLGQAADAEAEGIGDVVRHRRGY